MSAKKVSLFLTLVLSTACQKQVLIDYQQIPADRVSISLTPNQPGLRIPSGFTGLGFETDMLTGSALAETNTALVRMVKLLGAQGSIRIGGVSTDQLFWTGRPRNGSTDVDSLYTDDIARLFAFTKATGWKVLFALNLAQSTTAKTAEEAEYVVTSGGSNLSALELGSAPDTYTEQGLRPSGFTNTDFQNEWDSFYASVHPEVPKTAFAGPCTNNNMAWLLPFIPAESTRVALITNHYYRTGSPTSSSATVTHLLETDGTLLTDLTEAMAACRTAGIPLRMEECNSVAGGGKKGVSNTFASALWGLDFMYILAGAGVTGVNFQGNDNSYYSPLSITPTDVTAEPLFYGMLCFQLGSQGRFIPLALSNTSNLNVTAYAVLADNGKITLTVVNKNSTVNADLTITAGMPLTSAGYITLASAAASLTATSGITLGGNAVKSNGDFTTPVYTPITQITGDTALITVPAASAMVISLQ